MPQPKVPTEQDLEEYNELLAAAKAARQSGEGEDAAQKALTDFMRKTGVANEVYLGDDGTGDDTEEGNDKP